MGGQVSIAGPCPERQSRSLAWLLRWTRLKAFDGRANGKPTICKTLQDAYITWRWKSSGWLTAASEQHGLPYH